MKNTVKKEIKSILIIGSIGIGNLLLFSSALKLLRKGFPGSKISIVVLKSSFKELYENDDNVDEIIIIPTERKVGLLERLKIIKTIRAVKPDLCITTFPANRMEYNLLAFLSGAKTRIAHRYNLKYLRTLSFLQNNLVKVEVGLHDLEQNLNLLKPLGMGYDNNDKFLFMPLSGSDRNFAEAFLKEKEVKKEDIVIGFHPGSSFERGMFLKRWEEEKFARLGDKLTKDFQAKIVLFGGKEEEQIKINIQKSMMYSAINVTNVSLGQAAALLGRCTLFITNDSGLMHIAVSQGVKTIALFGPTDQTRTAPYGESHVVIRRGLECSPCWSIHNLGVGNVNCIHEENICMRHITVDEVYQAAKKIIGEKV